VVLGITRPVWRKIAQESASCRIGAAGEVAVRAIDAGVVMVKAIFTGRTD